MASQLLDPLPLVVLFALFALLSLASYEVGFRLGRWWQQRMPGEQEGPTGVLVGSLLALMAFLLAVTMGMASDRFDARRTAVVTEANAIESSYFQAPYLSGSAAVRTQDLLREYLSLRIVSDDTGELAANLERSVAIQAELWSTLAAEARTTTSPDLVAAFGDSLAELVNVGESRVTAGIYARVPETVLILLLAGSAFALGMVGYSAGIAGQRSIVSAVVLVIALGAVLMLVIDIDRPQQGLIRVSQQPLLDVQGRIGLPSP